MSFRNLTFVVTSVGVKSFSRVQFEALAFSYRCYTRHS